MIMWIMAGLVATFGALCYAEVGLLIPKSGGEYPIIYDSYGDIPGFLFAWVSNNLHWTTFRSKTKIAYLTSHFRPVQQSFVQHHQQFFVSHLHNTPIPQLEHVIDKMVRKNYWQFVLFGQVIWFSIKCIFIYHGVHCMDQRLSQDKNRLKLS